MVDQVNSLEDLGKVAEGVEAPAAAPVAINREPVRDALGRTQAAGRVAAGFAAAGGAPRAVEILESLIDVDPSTMVVAGNSSLSLMYFCVLFALQQGVAGAGSAWQDESSNIKFLAPSPGYDRHFAICQQLGIELILQGQYPDKALGGVGVLI